MFLYFIIIFYIENNEKKFFKILYIIESITYIIKINLKHIYIAKIFVKFFSQ